MYEGNKMTRATRVSEQRKAKATAIRRRPYSLRRSSFSFSGSMLIIRQGQSEHGGVIKSLVPRQRGNVVLKRRNALERVVDGRRDVEGPENVIVEAEQGIGTGKGDMAYGGAGRSVPFPIG